MSHGRHRLRVASSLSLMRVDAIRAMRTKGPANQPSRHQAGIPETVRPAPQPNSPKTLAKLLINHLQRGHRYFLFAMPSDLFHH